MKNGMHHVIKPFAVKTERNEYCRYRWLSGGKLHHCLQPTDGHTYCDSCERHRASLKAGSNYRNYTLIGVVSH